MKKNILRKIPAMLLAGVMVLSLLAGCTQNTASISVATLEETNTDIEENDIQVSVDKSQDKTEADIPEKEPEKVFSLTPGLDEESDAVEFPEGIQMINFSGVDSKKFISDNYSAYEGEKYILLVDKNVELPGNYAIMLDDITDTIEEVSGLSFNTRTDFGANMVKTFSGDTPWEGLKSGNKYIIQLNNSNRNPNEYPGPTWNYGYVSLEDAGIYTFSGEKVEDSDYSRIMWVLIRGLLNSRYPDLTSDDEADSAIEYFTIEAMEEKHPDFKRMVNNLNYEGFNRDVTEENVEEQWVSKHRHWPSWEERTTFETLFYVYMMETQGKDFFKSITSDNYSDKNMSRKELASRIKELYGDDVFTKYVAWANSKLPDAPVKLTLSGDTKSMVYAEQNCYIEGERCFVYIEKGIYVPEDLIDKTDAIVAALERKMWNLEGGIKYQESQASLSGTFCGISNNGKLPIVFCCDEESLGLISAYYGPDVNIYDYGMETNNRKKVDYECIAHECSHAIMDAKGNTSKIGKIMTEGSADYYAEFVCNELGIAFDTIVGGYYYKTAINKSTAEELFLNDFKDVGHADRGAEYGYGYYLSKYLDDTFGDEYLEKVTKSLKNSNVLADGDYGNDTDRQLRLKVFKAVFGDNVFADFGQWYTNNY